MLVEMAADASRPAEVRVQAMAALAQLRDARINAVITAGLKDSRAGGAQRSPPNPGRFFVRRKPSIDCKRRSTRELAASNRQPLPRSARSKPAQADAMLGKWFDKLLAGQAPRELQLDLLEAAAQRGSPALKDELARYESSRPKKESIDPYRETLYGGDAQRGRAIFFDRTEVGCVRCHTIPASAAKSAPI